ncbi:hypothetical protein CQ020_01425 [Arthrobacter sp. MYb23]|nr:hypothetical protein CQ020_01425 [Arthrobacter sp. MYb23]
MPFTGALTPVSPPALRPPPAGGFTTGGLTTGGFTTGGLTTGGFTTGGLTTGGFTTGGFTTGGFTTGGLTVAVDPPPTPTEVAPRLTGAVIGMISWVPERIPSLPEVEEPDVPGAEVPEEPVPVFVAEESPNRPAEVEPRLIGAVIGATTCVPEPMPSEPEVVLPEFVPVGAVPPLVPVFVADESPNRPAEVEPRLIGAVIGATTCVPEPTPSEPEVVLPEFVPVGAGPPLVPVFVADESPSKPAEVEPRLIGAIIGATTCVPEPTPSEPEVVLPEVVPVGTVPPVEPEVPVPVFVADESPNRPAEVAPRLIGTATGATTCVPEPTPSEPDVEEPKEAGADVPGAEVPGEAAVPDVADESPPTPTAVAPMLTGTEIGATT